MYHFVTLVVAVEYIELNLERHLTVRDVAQAAYVSVSHLQSMFSRTFHSSVGEYMIKRKLCAAASDLTNTDKRVTEIAYDYGYANAESFSRAFKKQFRTNPSAYRRQYHFTELYPKFMIHEKEGFCLHQRYDLTQISEKIIASKGTYIICADIDHLMEINEKLGLDAGDAAIAETAARIGKSVPGDMNYFRIGGDHFVILSGSGDLSLSEDIARSIISQADNDVVWSGGLFRFSITMGIIRIPEQTSDAQAVIQKSEAAMLAAKREGRNSYKVV